MKSLFAGIFTLLFSFNAGSAIGGDAAAGEARYGVNCFICHGQKGKGMASYPKLAGKPVPYIVDKLETYRAGTRIGPNSDLMIMNAEPLTDEEIANLAAYLSSVKSN
ncbi:c-type cytochrome [Burkholderiales bacterium]|nr:c-type cytochrome [Burkholderiales bacterium]